ncbi:MAG TPA: NDP-sugar synthase [Solirubrobacteraceae bacterium]|jgi:NDP-sugar pyrophosphorylase family protein|nr:NDP-sugar synthase [Solirubrobacteraceae bacterium]
MHAMILAAGLGTRLGALGAATPKILIDVGGRPLLARHLDYLAAMGVDRVVINLHHHADQVEAYITSHNAPVEVTCVREVSLLGTAGGVRNALDELTPGPLLVIYGDVLFPDPVDVMLEQHRSTDAAATIAVHGAASTTGKGVVEVAGSGRVLRFVEKGGKTDGPALINSGIYVLNESVLDGVAGGGFSDFGSDIFPALLAEGKIIWSYRLPRPVIDIGTPEGLALAREVVLAGAQEVGEVGR